MTADWDAFCTLLSHTPRPRVLEIGGRDVALEQWRPPPHWERTGLDLLAGPAVDRVGDAHQLTRHFAPGTFDAIYSIAVFEHLLMPWRVVTEMNRVLRPGGVARLTSHECFPLHEEPWDFWRFPPAGWRALFDAGSGFEVIAQESVAPAEVRRWRSRRPASRVYQHTIVHVRKVGEVDPQRAWDVLPSEILPPRHSYAAASARSGIARLATSVRSRLRRVVGRTESRPDPFELAAKGPWHVVLGPGSQELALDAAWLRPVSGGATSVAVRSALADLAPASVDRLALLGVLHHDPSPWTLAAHIDRVLRPGGLAFVDTTHASVAEHEGFGVSSEALLGLFHVGNGFRIEQRAMLDPASVHADRREDRCSPLAMVPMRTVGLIRKVGCAAGARMSWR